MSSNTKRPRAGWKIVGVVLIGVILQLVLNHLPQKIHHQYGDLFRAAIVLLVGGAISYIVENWLARLSLEHIGSRRTTSIRFLARLVLYLAIVLALLAAFGVGLSSVVFGSAFVTVILGLAGQNFFSNLIAGIGLVIFHPFEVGDRISFVAWQYPMLMPSFPHESMKPAYSGIVSDINLAYTTIQTNEGTPMLIPNGVIIQSAIHNHERQHSQRLRFRFDLDLDLDPMRLVHRLEELLKDWPYPVEVRLADVAAATFAIVLTAIVQGRREEDVRSALLGQLIPLVQDLRRTSENPRSESH